LAKLDFCNILDHFVFFLPRSTFWATLGFGLIFDFTLCVHYNYRFQIHMYFQLSIFWHFSYLFGHASSRIIWYLS
jgi:hypothetical protein